MFITNLSQRPRGQISLLALHEIGRENANLLFIASYVWPGAGGGGGRMELWINKRKTLGSHKEQKT